MFLSMPYLCTGVYFLFFFAMVQKKKEKRERAKSPLPQCLQSGGQSQQEGAGHLQGSNRTKEILRRINQRGPPEAWRTSACSGWSPGQSDGTM